MEQRKCSQCYLQYSECMSMALTMVQDNCTSSCTLNHCYKGSSLHCGKLNRKWGDNSRTGFVYQGWIICYRLIGMIEDNSNIIGSELIAIEISVDHIIEFGNILGYFVYL